MQWYGAATSVTPQRCQVVNCLSRRFLLKPSVLPRLTATCSAYMLPLFEMVTGIANKDILYTYYYYNYLTLLHFIRTYLKVHGLTISFLTQLFRIYVEFRPEMSAMLLQSDLSRGYHCVTCYIWCTWCIYLFNWLQKEVTHLSINYVMYCIRLTQG